MTLNSTLLDALSEGPFELTSRPEPVPGDLRLAWGIALMLLILGNSRGTSASLQKLHFLAHSVRTAATRNDVERVFAGTKRGSEVVIRIEPWLNRAIAFARADDLIDLNKGKTVKLTSAGIAAYKALVGVNDLMIAEKAFLSRLSKAASEGAIDKILRMETLL